MKMQLLCIHIFSLYMSDFLCKPQVEGESRSCASAGLLETLSPPSNLTNTLPSPKHSLDVGELEAASSVVGTFSSFSHRASLQDLRDHGAPGEEI